MNGSKESSLGQAIRAQTKADREPRIKEIFQDLDNLKEQSHVVRGLSEAIKGRLLGSPAEAPKETPQEVIPGIFDSLHLELVKISNVIEDTRRNLVEIDKELVV